jgi:hypothetical protein
MRINADPVNDSALFTAVNGFSTIAVSSLIKRTKSKQCEQTPCSSYLNKNHEVVKRE